MATHSYPHSEVSVETTEPDFLENWTTHHHRLAQNLEGVFECQIPWVHVFEFCYSVVEHFLPVALVGEEYHCL